MFIQSHQVDSGVIISDGKLLSLNSVFTCTSSIIANFFGNKEVNTSLSTITASLVQNQIVNTSTLYCIGNLECKLTVFFPPNHFNFLFGNNGIQTNATVIIQKSDLIGLNPSVNNSAESLLVGILNKILGGRNKVEFPEITFTYWGYGHTEGMRIDTILIDFRNKLTTLNIYELPEISTIIDPDNY